MGYRPKSITTELDNVKYEQYCNSIASRLSQLVNPDDVDCKRWPWELLQNAKDTVVKRPADKRFVEITIKYYINEFGKKELYFEHNGEQFTSKAIVGLIWKFSAEKRDEEITEDGLKRDKQSTGRFGTGFLTTHALSRTISISGSMHDCDKSRNISVDFTLHREGPDDEAYKEGVRKTEEEAKYDVKPLSGDEVLPTRFTYYLKNDQNIKAAEMGIDNVRHNSAQTMLFCPTVRSITVIDDVNHKTFSISRIGTEQKVGNIKITSFKETFDGAEAIRKFISSEIDEYSEELSTYWRTPNRHMRLQVAVEITESMEILPIPFETSPSVYCSLPLIGFERMTLPFYVNSNDFEPATERTSLFLNKLRRGTTYDDAQNSDVDIVYNNGVNWAILERSVSLYEELVDYLIENDFTKRYNLLSGLNSILNSNSWKDEELNCLAARFVLPIRYMLFDKLLVRTKSGYRKLNSGIKFPECSELRDRRELYDLCEAVYPNNLSVYDENQSWLDLKWGRFTRFSTNFDEIVNDERNPSFPFVNYNDIAEYVESAKCVEALTLALPEGHSKVKWLNKFYEWIENAKLSILAEKSIVPNRKGIFCSCKPGTNLKDAADIPTSIFTFMKKMQLDWDENLLLEGIEHVSLEKETKDHIVSAIKEQTKDYITKPLISQDSILTSILPLLLAVPDRKEDGRVVSFYEKRCKIISILRTIHPEKVERQESEVLDLKSECWEYVDDWFMKYAASKISAKGKLDVPKEDDSEEVRKSKYCTATWLEDTLCFMIDKGYIHQEDISTSDEQNGLTLIPNAYGDFCALNNLHMQGNVPDELLDPILSLTGNDINRGLLLKDFTLSSKMNISEYHLSDWTTIYSKFFKNKENDADCKKVADYLIHLRPSDLDTTSEIRKLFDRFENVSKKATELNTSDNDIWKGAKKYIIDYLSKSTSAFESITKIGEHFITMNEDVGDSSEEVNADRLGLGWVNELSKYIKAYGCHVDPEYKIVPDYYGNLHIPTEILYDGSALKQYQNVDKLIEIIDSNLWNFFADKEPQDESLTSKISHPDFLFANDYKEDTASKMFGLVDRMISYCYENFNATSKEYVKHAVEVLQNFFEDNKGSSLNHLALERNEKLLKGLFTKTYCMMGDMLVNLVYDRETRERLNKINDRFTPEEQDMLVRHKDAVKKYVENLETERITFTIRTLEGNKLVEINEPPCDGMSTDDKIAHVQQAKMDVALHLKELGYSVNMSLVTMPSYSQLYGISDSDGIEIPVVVHSYKSNSRDFVLNPYDWSFLHSSEKSMLWVVPSEGGPQCVPLCMLPIRMVSFKVDCNSIADQSKLIALTEVAKNYTYINFDFGTEMPSNQKEPFPFNYLPEKMIEEIDTITEICDKEIPVIPKQLPHYNYRYLASGGHRNNDLIINNPVSTIESIDFPIQDVREELTGGKEAELL